MDKLQTMGEQLTAEGNHQPATSQSSQNGELPDRETAALLSTLIDKSRAALGWSRLNPKEQNIAIVTWFEILSDAGIPARQYAACYRSAQQRKTEQMSQGGEAKIVTPNDLAVEWSKVRKMNDELDRSHLLPSHASSACRKCFGVQPHIRFCDHEYVESEDDPDLQSRDISIRAKAQAEAAAMIRAANSKIGRPKPVEREATPPRPTGIDLQCDSCGIKINTVAHNYEEGQVCGVLLNAHSHTNLRPELCTGIYRRVESPVVEETKTSIAFTITRAVRQQLYDLNYTRLDVDGMKPDEAQDIITECRFKVS